MNEAQEEAVAEKADASPETAAWRSSATALLKISGGLFAIIVLFLILLLISLNLWPLGVAWNQEVNPAQTPEEALDRVAAIRSEEDEIGILEECHTDASYNPDNTRTVVLFHGITNCPAQYAEFTPLLDDEGLNYVLVRLPNHGYSDRHDARMADLRVDPILEFSQRAVDIAQGFGQPVEVFGLSAGGVAVAWLSQNRDDVDTFYITEPSVGFKAAPTYVGRALTNGLRMMPNIRWWWDSEEKRPERPRYAADYVNTKAMTQFFRIGHDVLAHEDRFDETARHVIVMNDNDRAIQNDYLLGMHDSLRNLGADTELCVIDESLEIDHDFIDPFHPDQRQDFTYPELILLFQDRSEESTMFSCS